MTNGSFARSASPTPDLTILCVTLGEVRALPFLDAFRAMAGILRAECVIYRDDGAHGYAEPVLPLAVEQCHGEYVLRVDDDEQCSESLIAWLATRAYRDASQWWFPRVHLWENTETAIVNHPLWPDQQTRLTLWELSMDRPRVHASSPHGLGQQGSGVLIHHKFLVRSLDERRRLAAHYDRIQPGAGSGKFRVCHTPEDVLRPSERKIVPLRDVVC